MEIRKKPLAAAATVIVLVLAALSIVYLFKPAQAATLDYETTCSGTVDKKPSESFTVKITFKNKGSTEGTWNVAVTFEGEDWTWKGEKKQLSLKPDEKETLTWEGEVPEDAVVDSVARLIVYYDDKYVALNWWIHVVSGAEFCIVDSKVS